jgi:hypothetical protein
MFASAEKNRYPWSHKYSRLRKSSFIYDDEYLVGCKSSGIWPFLRNEFSVGDFKVASVYIVGVINILI